MSTLALAAIILLVVLLLAGGYMWWSGQPEVYFLGVPSPTTKSAYSLDFVAAKAAAAKAGGALATIDQVAAAQKAGAQWCGWGWTLGAGGAPVVAYPHQIPQGCDPTTHAGVNTMTPDPGSPWGAAVYGVKPAKAPAGTTILQWFDAGGYPPGTAAKWSRYSL